MLMFNMPCCYSYTYSSIVSGIMIGQVFLWYGTVWFVVLLFTAVSCDSDESVKSNNQTATPIIGS